MMEKKFTFDNTKVAKLLEQKNNLVKEGVELTKQIEKLEKDRAKVGYKIQKVKDKVVPMVEKELVPSIALDEFEELRSVDLVDGQVTLTIVDRIEEFKNAYLEAKKQKDA